MSNHTKNVVDLLTYIKFPHRNQNFLYFKSYFFSGFLHNAAVLFPEQRGVQYDKAALGTMADHQESYRAPFS